MSWSEWRKKLLDRGYIKPIGTTVIVTSLGWLFYEIYATTITLQTVGKISIIHRRTKYIDIDGRFTKGFVLGPEGYLEPQLGWNWLVNWFSRSRYSLAQKQLLLAQSGEDSQLRRDAVVGLARSKHLSEADLVQLAQSLDADTAVALARQRSINSRFFVRPPTTYKVSSNEELINEMRDVLYQLNRDKDHLCVKYFLSKAFPEYEKQNIYLLDAELMLTEPWTLLSSQDNLLPLCVQALDHHISTVSIERSLVQKGGLPLLMAVYKELKDDPSVLKMICRILTRICSHPDFLPQIFESGWLGVLAEWLNSNDQQLSLLAGQCLANLDKDDPSHAHYGKHVLSLYPLYRSHPPEVDVVFVHGLLGGVLSTWRQRDRSSSTILALQKDDMIIENSTSERHTSDAHIREYLTTMSEISRLQWERLGSDFDFVVSDFPVNCKSCDFEGFTLDGKDPLVRKYGNDSSYTLCWPKDWLPQDCSSIRVLGIDYESRISEWFPNCTEKLRVKTLEERASIVLEELKRCGIGKRPTIWVAHSMGGLLVKKMLTKAEASNDFQAHQIAYNSKAIVFLSTPHLGCPLAKMNDILNYLLWPSTEVEELRQNSEVLNELHQNFNDLLRKINMRIVTFAEAKSTRISNFGVDLHIVPPEFSYFEIGDVFEMPCDHACVAKPYNRLSFIYQTVLKLIKAVQQDIK